MVGKELQRRQGQALVAVGKFDEVHVAAEKTFYGAVHGKPRHISRRYVEEGPQGKAAGGGPPVALGNKGGVSQFGFQLGFQGLPAQKGEQVVQTGPRRKILTEQRIKLSRFQASGQGVQGGDNARRLPVFELYIYLVPGGAFSYAEVPLQAPVLGALYCVHFPMPDLLPGVDLPGALLYALTPAIPGGPWLLLFFLFALVPFNGEVCA